MKKETKKIVLVMSFEDYVGNMGGTAKVIYAQESILRDNGFLHIFICPFHLLNEKTDENKWLVRVNGKIKCVKSMDDICFLFEKHEELRDCIVGIQIHHLKGVNFIDVFKLLNIIHCPIFFYLHDYYSMCSTGNGNLLINDYNLCNYQAYNPEICQKCDQYSLKTDDFRQLFVKYKERLTFIAPSYVCKKIWLNAYPDFNKQVEVIYHQRQVGEYKGNNSILQMGDRIKIAYVGVPKKNKGWNDFQQIVSEIKNNDLFMFYAFSNGTKRIENVKMVVADYRNEKTSMTSLLRKYEICIVLLLSVWPETYSYTYYESMASNAFVLAYNCSGNIAFQINKRGNGKVFNNVEELIGYLKRPRDVLYDINSYRAKNQVVPLKMEENEEFLELLHVDDKQIVPLNLKITNLLRNKTSVGLFDMIFYKNKLLLKKIFKK